MITSCRDPFPVTLANSHRCASCSYRKIELLVPFQPRLVSYRSSRSPTLIVIKWMGSCLRKCVVSEIRKMVSLDLWRVTVSSLRPSFTSSVLPQAVVRLASSRHCLWLATKRSFLIIKAHRIDTCIRKKRKMRGLELAFNMTKKRREGDLIFVPHNTTTTANDNDSEWQERRKDDDQTN